MKRIVAAALAVVIALLDVPLSAAADSPPAAAPFPVVPLPAAPHRSHVVAWVALGGGAAMLGGSFWIHERANHTYDEYLASTDADEISRLYDRTRTLDRLSGGTLIAGEAFLVTGIYLRFLRAPRESRVSLALAPGRCAATWHF